MKLQRLTTGSAILLALIIFASIIHPGLLWGIDSPGYLGPFQILAICLLTIFTYIVISMVSETAASDSSDKAIKLQRIAIIIFLAAILVLILYNLRSATQLWGDGYLRAHETSLGVRLHFTEPLDKLFQYVVFQTIGKWFGLSSIQTYQLVSIFGGALFFVFGIWFADRYGNSRRDKIIMGTFIFSSAIIAMFFGYVESYSISTPLLLMAIGITYFELLENRSIVPGLIIYFFACLFHMSLLAYAPAFIIMALIAYRHRKIGKAMTSIVLSIAIPIVLLAIAFIINRLQFGDEFGKSLFQYLLIPLAPNESGYWLFSWHHILDVINQLLLVAPAAVIVLIALFPFRANCRKSPELLFLIIASICGILFLIFFATAFGIGRDWDLFSSIALPLNILAAAILARRLSKTDYVRSFRIFLPILPAILISMSFVAVNAQGPASVRKYRAVINETDYGKNLNLENLANYYMLEGDTTNMYAALREASKIQPNPRYYQKIATQLLNDGLTERAVDEFYKALDIDSSYTPALYYLGITFEEIGNKDPRGFDLAEKYFILVQHYDPDFPNIHFDMGGLYLERGDYDKAISEYRTQIISDKDYLPAYLNLGLAFEKAQVYDSADYYYRYVIGHDANQFAAYISLAKMRALAGNKEGAIEILTRAEGRFRTPQHDVEIAKGFAMIPDYEKAIGMLEQQIESAQAPIDAYVTLANLYGITDRSDDGLRVLSLAGKSVVGPQGYVQIAEAFLQLDAKDSAEVYFLDAMSKDPSYGPAYQKLGTFYILQGKTEKAKQVLKLGLEYVINPRERAALSSILEKLNNK
jgi:tetratricopeptide (TPR) repeat protein